MKILIQIAALTGVCFSTALAHAQTVFFDDFNGDALLPHWNAPPAPTSWEYNVSDSMLNVTGLLSPSHPKSPTNFAVLRAVGAYAPQNDFQLDARMGWDSSETIARFDLTVLIGQGLVATIGYRPNPLNTSVGIVAATDSGAVAIPAPASGMHDFRMTRIGNVFNFYFDGGFFASLPSAYAGPVDGLRFFFSSPYPGGSGPFHIDSVGVQTIPVPGTLLALGAGLLSTSRRRRADGSF